MTSLATKNRVCPTEPYDRSIQAHQILDILTELIDEYQGMLSYLELISLTVNYHFPAHRKVYTFLNRHETRLYAYLRQARTLQYEYRAIVADYEHQFGKVDYKKLMHFTDFSVALENLMEHKDVHILIKDFLDG